MRLRQQNLLRFPNSSLSKTSAMKSYVHRNWYNHRRSKCSILQLNSKMSWIILWPAINLVVMRAKIKKLIRSHVSGHKLVTMNINKIFPPLNGNAICYRGFSLFSHLCHMFVLGKIQFSMHLLGTYCEQSTIPGKISIGLRDLQNRIRHNLVAEGDVCNRSLLQWLQAVRSPRIPRSSRCKRHLVFFGATVKGILWPGVSSVQILTSLPKSEMKGIHLTLERVPCDDNSQCQGLSKGQD